MKTFATLSHPAQSTDVRVEQRLFETGADAEAHTQSADGTYRRLWPTSTAFAQYLCTHPALIRGKRVIEIGSGSGAIGLVCAALGAAHVCITDSAVHLIADNVAHNPQLSGMVSVLPLAWGKRSHIEACLQVGGHFDVVVACEVVYKVSLRVESP